MTKDLNFPKHTSRAEALIMDAVIREVLRRYCQIEVHDGEETVLEPSTDRALIQAESHGSDYTYYKIWTDTYIPLGTVWFVHGNGVDVLTDYTANVVMDDIVAEAGRVRDRLISEM